jgi:hypothetical protein
MPQGPRATARRHDWIDERSLALGRAIGEKLRADPSLVERAQQRIAAWESAAIGSGDRSVLPALAEWGEILRTHNLDALIDLLGSDTSERAARLRQSSPFVGVLTPAERDAIFARFERM